METMLSKYIDKEKKEISIDKDTWASLNQQYDKDVIKGWIIDEILEGNIRFPHLDITIEDAKEAFKKLCDYKCKDFQYSKTMTRYDYKYPIGDKYIAESIAGNDASNYFHQEARSFASGHNDPSPQEVWKSRHYLESSLKGIWTLKMKKLDMHCIRSSMAMRKYWASQFRPAMAKSIYEKFNAVDVLDFSSGWGDRLCGAYATKNVKSYIGIDPNKAVYDQYFKQIELYKTIVPEKKVTLFNSPAEDVTEIGANVVDTVFTSPPYFCAETYTQDDTQSWVRYGEVDSWLTGFMYKTLDMVWKALKPGGHLIVNISDVHRKGGVCHICDPMNDYIKDKLGGKMIDAFGMLIGKRPASHAFDGKSGICVEPIWAWTKPGDGIVVPDYERYTVSESQQEATVEDDNKQDNNITVETTVQKNDNVEEKDESVVEKEEEQPVVQKPTEPVKPVLEIVIEKMDENIDPRCLGRMMIELGNKVSLTIVHGTPAQDANDMVYRLCNGLGITMNPLYKEDGSIDVKYIGKNKLIKCQSDSKPVFEKVTVSFEE